MWTAAQEIDCMLRRPSRYGSIGFCVHCGCDVRGVIKNWGYEYGYKEDDVCGIHGDALKAAREESEAGE